MNNGSITEEEMVQVFLENWKKEKGQISLFSREVKIYQKRIDLVQIPKFKNNRLGTAHAIEFKLANWKAGFRQAKCNRIFVPKNSLAIWKEFSHRVNQEELVEEGIGLIEVSYKGNKTILKPRNCPYVDKFLYNKLRNTITRKIENRDQKNGSSCSKKSKT